MRFVPSWFPGATWKRKAKLYRDYMEKMLRVPFELVKQQIVRAKALYIAESLTHLYSTRLQVPHAHRSFKVISTDKRTPRSKNASFSGLRPVFSPVRGRPALSSLMLTHSSILN